MAFGSPTTRDPMSTPSGAQRTNHLAVDACGGGDRLRYTRVRTPLEGGRRHGCGCCADERRWSGAGRRLRRVQGRLPPATAWAQGGECIGATPPNWGAHVIVVVAGEPGTSRSAPFVDGSHRL